MSEPLYLWLLPPASVQATFAGFIERLAQRFGTAGFIPHITLAGSLDLPADETVRRTAELAARLDPVAIRLTGIGATDEYFRCLFMRAEHSAALLATHETACAQLARPPEKEFMPHLSLIYGKLSQDQKNHIIDEIGNRLDIAFIADRIGLCRASGSPAQWQLSHTYSLTGRLDHERPA